MKKVLFLLILGIIANNSVFANSDCNLDAYDAVMLANIPQSEYLKIKNAKISDYIEFNNTSDESSFIQMGKPMFRHAVQNEYEQTLGDKSAWDLNNAFHHWDRLKSFHGKNSRTKFFTVYPSYTTWPSGLTCEGTPVSDVAEKIAVRLDNDWEAREQKKQDDIQANRLRIENEQIQEQQQQKRDSDIKNLQDACYQTNEFIFYSVSNKIINDLSVIRSLNKSERHENEVAEEAGVTSLSNRYIIGDQKVNIENNLKINFKAYKKLGGGAKNPLDVVEVGNPCDIQKIIKTYDKS